MGQGKRATLEFMSRFEEGLLAILGVYLLVFTAVLGAVGGLFLAEHLWARVAWIETTLIVTGLVLGAGAGMLTLGAVHERLSEGARSSMLWLALSFVPGAAVPLAIVECIVRVARWWARDEVTRG